MWLFSGDGLYNMDRMRNIKVDGTRLQAEYLGSYFLTLRDYDSECESHHSLSLIYNALKSGRTVCKLPREGWLEEAEHGKNNV